MRREEVHRSAISAATSAVIHIVVLAILATTSIRIGLQDQSAIPLVIRNPAPPPPPPGGGAGTGSGATAVAAPNVPPEQPKSLEQPKPVEQPRPVEQPKPAERPKIAAKPKPIVQTKRSQPTPAAPSAPEAAIAAAGAGSGQGSGIAGGGEGGGVAGGVLGGVLGGQVGGKIGGRLGGTGDDVWSADEVAVPPKLVEQVRPLYPAVARARGEEGVVIVQAVIDRSGRVEPAELRVVESHPPFDDAAVTAFRQWKYQPGRNDSGQAVRVRIRQGINFHFR
jgi:protein TonB